ncbi:GTPase [Xylariaceae sp. FL0255]|nr:GTPase [Xylariaceae sp. FL0255]
MSSDAGLVGSLVERLTSRLPYRTGTSTSELKHDNVATITRASIVQQSPNSISNILHTLVPLLEDLSRPYKTLASRPAHILQSEVYIVALAADCCTAHWESLRKSAPTSTSNGATPAQPLPKPLQDGLVKRLFSYLKLLLEPISDSYIIPAKAILEDDYVREFLDPRYESPVRSNTSSSGSDSVLEPSPSRDGPEDTENIEQYVNVIISFLSAGSWTISFDCIRQITRSKKTQVQNNAAQSQVVTEEDRSALVLLGFISYLWVDAQKLGLIMQELSSTFLHFRRVYQNTVALTAPLLILKWIERYPHEFVRLHSHNRKLDGGPETMADMAQSLGDNGRKRSSLYPFQATLLMLVPEVFEVASNLRNVKSSTMSKRIAFLDGLRKGLRNRNETAGICLLILLRAARHFPADSDSAYLSYVMDVQDELRDAIFRRYHPVSDSGLFEQDLTTAALISLIHLNFDTYAEPLAQLCTHSSAPLCFQVAIMQTCSYFARKPNAQDYQRLFIGVAKFTQDQLKAMSAASTELCIDNSRRPHRRVSHARSSNEIIICNILKFWTLSPLSLFDSSSPDDKNPSSFYEEIFEAFVSCLVTANDTVRFLSQPLAEQILPTNGLLASVRKAAPLDSGGFKLKFWKLTSHSLLDMVDKYRQHEDSSILKSIYSYFRTNLVLFQTCPELCRLEEDIPEGATLRMTVESLLLLTLNHPDIEVCRLVTSTMGIWNDVRILKASLEANSSTLQVPNSDIYAEIASSAFKFTGMMAFQKRTRGLLRRIQSPGPGILDAWERAYDKWLHLSKEVSTASLDSTDEKIFSEWRNLSGFLASMGGVCTMESAYSFLDDPVVNALKWIDRPPSEESDEPILTRYLRLSTQLLACPHVRVRETIRDVLSTETSPTLYQALLKALTSELDVLFAGAMEGSDRGQEGEIIFAEQAASLLKTIVEKLETPSDLTAAASIDFSSLGLSFVKFLDGATENATSLRVKTKICQLCEAITKKKQHLNFRDDVARRNQLLEYIFSWIARPHTPHAESVHRAHSDISHRAPHAEISLSSNGRQDELIRLQKELDKACFRCLAALTYRLPLQPGEGQNDISTSELKSQMFHTYFNRFLSLLNLESSEGGRGESSAPTSTHDEAGSTSALAITILSNLLSANVDVGLKHSLNIGYQKNIEIRTAFVKVLHNILIQGTEFSTLTDKAVNEKYDSLLHLLTRDMSLVVAMSTVCPSSEVEELTVAMLNIFEYRGRTFELLEALIKQEIEDTENEAELLRRNCVATKMLSVYAKWKGPQYLKSTLQKVVERLMLTSKDLDLELDPSRISSQEELEKNAMQLRIVAKVFIDDICASSANIPPEFRKVCSIISTAVMSRFQEAKYTAVGAFIFLRFFCPAIVAPDSEKLVDVPPSKEMRRGLLLIAKVIQNLANNVLFGAKEPYMYPLNDFLTQNIYKVTTFLREISVPPESLEMARSDIQSFDFGSCVVLHRFLYEHWDNVRQRLLSQERRENIRSPSELARGRSPVLEPLRALVTTLGPPSLAVTWNRPQITNNDFVTYSRFQDFMLRNAFRDNGSFVASRTIYDGGESKDGLQVMCIILRHIDPDMIDFDFLVYSHLKLVSRLWHKPFGLLIDATCDNGRHEYHGEIHKKLEQLATAEVAKNFTRVYIYNMNSTYRKTFRRRMRMVSKGPNPHFRPGLEIYLLGTLQDLQTHFHLSQLHLPKETISVVTDTRYVFQPVTRLSKTKGQIDVTIKVGSQFVQVTTVRKQEVDQTHRLNTIINDIFRLGDVDEAPTPISTEDDSAFGLRADSGKIVMYFQSPKKNEILQSIRTAKAKYGKDTRTVKSFERLVRPQDVPGTLLNLALSNLAVPDQSLRVWSYNLLGALCQAFKFKAAHKFLCTKDVHIPLDPNQFIVNISKTLAQEEPQLTADFLNEFFVGWEHFSEDQKPLTLAYMAPWLSSLRTSLLGEESESERGKEKISAIFQKLIDAVALDPSLNVILEQTVWPAIYKDEVLLDIFLEEIIKAALVVGPYDELTQSFNAIIIAIGTITLRGKVISRLRKALNRSVLRPTKHLPENAVWDEICILLQFCLALSFDCGVQSQLYMPEIFHIITMLANTGSLDVRASVHHLLINTLHAACTSFKLGDAQLVKLRSILELVTNPKNDMLSLSPTLNRDSMSVATIQESGQTLAATEHLATLLFDTCTVAAPSVDLANAWRSRWMSLVASTAFQNNPAIQPRAFTVMGCLAREEIDDDLLYQVLVALRNSITRFGEDGSTDMLNAVGTSLTKMISKLGSTSRYGLQLFWLAISLVRLMPTARLFNQATQLLEAVLANLGTSPELRSEKTAQFLLQGRSTLEEATIPLDEVYGVHFTPDRFHFAVSACLVRGLTDPVTKQSTLSVLSTLLELTTNSSSKGSKGSVAEFYRSPYMALIQARVGGAEAVKECLWSAGINPANVPNLPLSRCIAHAEHIKDKDLLLHTAIELVDFCNLEDEVQTLTLTWLIDLAAERPAVIVPLCPTITSLLDHVVLHAQNPATMKAAHELLRVLTSDSQFGESTKDDLADILEDAGFEGLWRSHSFLQMQQDLDKQLIVFTDKLIELIIL